MIRYPVILGLLLIAGCRDAEKLRQICGEPCWASGAPAGWETGTCHSGIMICDDLGQNGICVGAQGRETEVCDNLDNNCDGRVDEGLSDCCLQPIPETCNNRDDDCNGVVDDIPITEFCYEGPEGTLSYGGGCHPGVRACSKGRMFCKNQGLPRAETCDGVDNDCNGKVDDGVGTAITAFDLVFVIDASGSMTDDINIIRNRVQNFAGRYGALTKIRWALVTAPDHNYGLFLENPRLVQNFTDAAGFTAAISSTEGGGGSPLEPTLDALDMICATRGSLGLTWTPGAQRRIVVFSDETPQSWTYPYSTPSSTATGCKSASIPVYIFTELPDQGWEQVAQITGGRTADIRIDFGPRLDDLISEITCQ